MYNDDYLNDEFGLGDEGLDGEMPDDFDEFAPLDPFEGLTKKEQDTFFRILDLMPREHLEAAMDYFMDRPAKIRAVVDYAKKKKELFDEGNEEELQKLFKQERINIETLDQQILEAAEGTNE